MARQGTYLVPTLSTWDIRERMDSQDGASRDQVTDNLERKENSLASFKRAMEAGVKIATGTDAGGSPVRHGFVAREIELMVQAGMSPQAALEASTRVAADLLGVLDLTGTIEVGKRADMVLVDGDPHSDPSAFAQRLGRIPGRTAGAVGPRPGAHPWGYRNHVLGKQPDYPDSASVLMPGSPAPWSPGAAAGVPGPPFEHQCGNRGGAQEIAGVKQTRANKTSFEVSTPPPPNGYLVRRGC